jgi:hypothetical protein
VTEKQYQFADYVQMDPRIGELLREAQRADHGDAERFCRFNAWYAPGGFRSQVVHLVGYMREGQDCPLPLQSSQAYDVVYERILGALPPCRGRCGCQ